MSHPTKRIPIMLSRRHAEYLIELVEDDLELDEEASTMTEEERLMAGALLKRLKDVGPAFDKWYQQQKRLGLV